MTAQLDADALYLMHLMSCALRDEAPRPLPAGATWDGVYSLALANSVTTTCAFAAAKAPGIDAPEAKRWRDEVYRNAVRHEAFAAERAAVFAEMDAAGLAHMPVKGVVTAREYPRPEMRWMCDNDFLFGRALPDGAVRVADHEDSLALRRIMEARGYEVIEFEESKCDEYHKPPFFNFEPHRQLVQRSLTGGGYFAQAWSVALRTDGEGGLAYELPAEFNYLYQIAHAWNHFNGSGFGVRLVADEWVFLNALRDSADRANVDAELQKLGLAGFESDLARLVDAVIGNDACGRMLAGDADALAPGLLDMLAFMFGSGTYGTRENYAASWVRDDAAKHGLALARLRYILRRLFPTNQSLRHAYPVLQRAPWLRPAVDVYRFTVRLFEQRANLRTELSAVMGKGGKDEGGSGK